MNVSQQDTTATVPPLHKHAHARTNAHTCLFPTQPKKSQSGASRAPTPTTAEAPGDESRGWEHDPLAQRRALSLVVRAETRPLRTTSRQELGVRLRTSGLEAAGKGAVLKSLHAWGVCVCVRPPSCPPSRRERGRKGYPGQGRCAGGGLRHPQPQAGLSPAGRRVRAGGPRPPLGPAALTVRLGPHQQRHPLEPLHVGSGDVPGAAVVPLPVLVERVHLHPPPGVRHGAARPGPRSAPARGARTGAGGSGAARGPQRATSHGSLSLKGERTAPGPARPLALPARLSAAASAATPARPPSCNLTPPAFLFLSAPATGCTSRGYGGREAPPGFAGDGREWEAGRREGGRGRGGTAGSGDVTPPPHPYTATPPPTPARHDGKGLVRQRSTLTPSLLLLYHAFHPRPVDS